MQDNPTALLLKKKVDYYTCTTMRPSPYKLIVKQFDKETAAILK